METNINKIMELLKLNKFEEFNCIDSNYLDEEEVAHVMFFMAYYLTKNEKDIGNFLSDFNKKCKDKTPYFFTILKELDTSKKDIMDKLYNEMKKFPMYINPMFSDENLRETKSLIHLYTIMEENKELNESLLNADKMELKKKKRI